MHCHAGKERTGVVAALLLALAGVPDEVIAEDYVASDRYLASLYAEWAARQDDPEERVHGRPPCWRLYFRKASSYLEVSDGKREHREVNGTQW